MVTITEAVPEPLASVAAGEPEAVRECLFGFSDRSPWDAERPWAAAALFTPAAIAAATGTAAEGARDGVAAYRTFLAAAVDRAIARGVVLLEPTNVRADRHGYTWGAPVADSAITRRLGPEFSARLGWNEEVLVAERWYGSDDRQYPGFWRDGGFPVPLSWLVASAPEAALGASHLAAHGAGRGVVMKDLTPARPLSWQFHLGVDEGYEIVAMPPGTGLFLGVNEPERRGEKDRIIAHALEAIWRDLELAPPARHCLRLEEPYDGIETPGALEGGLVAFVAGLLDRDEPWRTVGDFLEHILASGINVVDPAGTGWTADGTYFPGNSLVQIHRPSPGDRIVIRERMPHALFGGTAVQGRSASAWVREFKATATGPRHAAIPSASQTWSLADNLLGAWPRAGKVDRTGVEEGIGILRESGNWRRFGIAEIASTAPGPVEVAEGIVFTRIHAETRFAACRVELAAGHSVHYRRHGLSSVFAVVSGYIRVRCAATGAILVERLGLGDAWSGEEGDTDEAFVFADRGDLVLEAVDGPATVYDTQRPVPGVPLPECVSAR